MLIDKFTQISLVAVALLVHCTSSSALDSVSVTAGGGNMTVVTRLGLQWDLPHIWSQNEHSHIADYLDVTIGQWRGNRYQNIPDQTQNFIDVGITPMLRWERNDRHGFYAEAGIGPHWLSKHYDNNGRQLSTKFEFGTRLGFGYVFQNAWDVGLMVQHLSNGGISKPNGGVNFGLVRFSRRF